MVVLLANSRFLLALIVANFATIFRGASKVQEVVVQLTKFPLFSHDTSPPLMGRVIDNDTLAGLR
jgi:hypothetical protein